MFLQAYAKTNSLTVLINVIMAIRTRCDCPLQSLAIPRNDHGRPQFHSLVHGGVSGVPRSRLEATHGWGVADQKLASGQRKKLLPLSLRRFL